MKAYLDGQFVDSGGARLSAFDAAVQHGVGLFETMRAYGGKVFRLEAHVERLIASARELGLSQELRLDPLCEAVELTLNENDLSDARIRLTVTGGDLSLLAAARGQAKQHTPTILITAAEPTIYPQTFFSDGVSATIADAKANPFDPLAGHKTTNYWSRLRSLTEAASKQAGEALWFSVTNHLCGGAVSNAFIVKGGKLLTPIARGEEIRGAIPSPTLPGITRAAVLEIAERLGIAVERRMLTISDVLQADELFLTNSSWLVLPVVKVEKEKIGDGVPGEFTKKILTELLTEIASLHGGK